MSAPKSRPRPRHQRRAAWWQQGTIQLLLGAAVVLVAGGIAGLLWLPSSSDTDDGQATGAIPINQQVDAFQLPNVAAQQTFSLSDDLGERDIVIVSYMGFF